MLALAPASELKSPIAEPAAAAASPAVAVSSASPQQHPAHSSRWLLWLALAALFAAGAFVRFHPSGTYPLVGYDEGIYRRYVEQLGQYGPTAYPDIVESYIIRQRGVSNSMLPPTRVLFLLGGWGWRAAFGGNAWDALRCVSALASVGTLIVAAGFAGRLGGRGWALAALALTAAAPLQIHLAQRALIDGFFSFWAVLALWALWECFQRPADRPGAWLWIYGGALAAMVLTKESTVFVMGGLGVLLVVNFWARFGQAGKPLWLMTVLAPCVGAAILVIVCGGLDRVLDAFSAFAHPPPSLKPEGPNYPFLTGDGPWSRYLVDWMLLCPAITVLAIGGLNLGQRKTALGRGLLFIGVFVVVTYVALSQLRFGLNLRHTTIWDLPLRLLALAQLAAWSEKFGARRHLFLALGVLLLCSLDLWSYYQFFMEHGIYDPVPEALLRALSILKH